MGWRLIIFGSLCLSACSTFTPEQRDGGPARPVDVSHVQDAQPAFVTRTRAGNAKTYTVLGQTYTILDDSYGYQERGVASWYGTKFHGRRTANGEVYDMFAMTAAHKTLPIPSYVRVTHVGNGRSVVVKINDRGPFHGNRIIDLSYAAARKLGIDATGTGLVDVVDITPVPGQQVSSVSPTNSGGNHSVSPPQPLPAIENSSLESGVYLQLGAFQQLDSALSLRSRLEAVLSGPVHIIEGEDRLHRVKLGPAQDQQMIRFWRQVLQANGMEIGHVVTK
jgi:rare lipoprotein A